MPSVLSRLVSGSGSDPRQRAREMAPALLGIGAVAIVVRLYRRHYRLHGASLESGVGGRSGGGGDKSSKKAAAADRAQVDWAFVKKLARIMRILVPRLLCGETLYMVAIAVSLLARTYADVWMITTSTKIEAYVKSSIYI